VFFFFSDLLLYCMNKYKQEGQMYEQGVIGQLMYIRWLTTYHSYNLS